MIPVIAMSAGKTQRDEYGLTEQQRRFADFYRADPNRVGSRAYKLAYPKAITSACERGASRLLRHSQLSAYISMLDDRDSEEMQITAREIIREYRRIALFDLGKMYRDDGTFLGIKELDDDTRAAVAGMELDFIGVDMIRKIKPHDKLRALDSLCKIKGLFEKDNKQRADAAAAPPMEIRLVPLEK